MSDGLIERLRKVEPDTPGERTRWYRNPDGPEAADRIAQLEAENERLREALGKAARASIDEITHDLREAAREALDD